MKLTGKCKWKPATIESSKLCVFLFFLFYFQFCIQAADVSEFFSLFFLVNVQAKQKQTLAAFGSHASVFARPVCISSLHRRWPHKACSSKSAPVQCHLPFRGCWTHTGAKMLCHGLSVSADESLPRWDAKTPAGGAEVKTEVQEEPRDSHISDIKYSIFYYLSAPPVLTLKHCGSSAVQYKCCYRLFS